MQWSRAEVAGKYENRFSCIMTQLDLFLYSAGNHVLQGVFFCVDCVPVSGRNMGGVCAVMCNLHQIQLFFRM